MARKRAVVTSSAVTEYLEILPEVPFFRGRPCQTGHGWNPYCARGRWTEPCPVSGLQRAGRKL